MRQESARHTINRLLGLIWVVAFALVSTSVLAVSCVKSVRMTEAPPYSFKDKTGQIHGLHMDMIREALRRIGCDVQFVEMPWARALRELQTGRLDLLAGAANTKEREIYAHFSKPTNSARTIVFLHGDVEKKYKLTKLADLLGTDFRLAVRRDASYGVEYDALVHRPEFVKHLTYVPSYQTGFLMLGAGRVDGLIADELTGLLSIERMGLNANIKPSALVTSNDPDFVAFSKLTNSATLVQQFNASLESMVSDGSYKKLLELYLPCPISVEKLGCR